MRVAGLAEILGFGSSSARGWIGALALATAGLTVPAMAQETAIIQPGYAVVTGFSGTVAGEAPEGEDPVDYLTIDYNGAAANVIDLMVMGNQGELTEAPKTLSLKAADIGQVFGVALDDAQQPNIYLAATSAYGLSISLTDAAGYVKRLHAGAPGAQFVPGQFGPAEQGGGPGSIWRVDGVSGEVSLFASIAGAEQGVAALGGLAFDPVSRQLFAVERGNGLIHRFSLDGVERGTYDHGTEGRPGAGLAPVPLPPPFPVNIDAPSFNTENPTTWRYAPIARRVFGLAVRNSRLYYSVAQGPQIWSAGISGSGAVGGSPRIEVNVPALQGGIEIASIAFDGQGRMYLAERGVPTGDYQLKALANDGSSRVLRYLPKPAGDPTPGFWTLEPEQYAIGMPAPYNNAQGGVALNYGYDDQGTINFGACRATVWATGERLLDPGDPSTPPDSYPLVDGLQGQATSLVEPQNTPPFYSWFVDYDDAAGTPEDRGRVGAIAIYAPCGGGTPLPPPPPPPPSPYCPPGTYFDNGQCLIIPTCPPGTEYSDGLCIYPTCPPGYVEWQGQCVPPPQSCPPGTFFYQGQCVPIGCPPGMFMKPNGYCACKPGDIFFQGKCQPPKFCPPWMITLPGGICWCPLGTEFDNKGKCVPICKPFEDWINGKCWPKFCKPGEIKLPSGKCVPPCKPGWKMLPNGQCVPGGIVPECPPKKKWIDGICVPICKPFEKLIGGDCVPFKPKPIGPFVPHCGPLEHLVDGLCVPFKPKLKGPIKPDCKVFEHLVDGECVPFKPKPIGPIKPDCKVFEHLVDGVCVPLKPKSLKPFKPIEPIGPKEPACKPNEKLINGDCVPLPIGPKPIRCKPFENLVDGACVPKQFKKLEPIEPKPIDPNPIDPDRIKAPKIQIQCGPNEKFKNGKCKPDCPEGQKFIDGACQARDLR